MSLILFLHRGYIALRGMTNDVTNGITNGNTLA